MDEPSALLEVAATGSWVARIPVAEVAVELLDLYLRAYAFAYPSTFEGFGMPVLEALAAGIPTVVSSVEPMKGIAGGAALLVNPESEEDMAEKLLELFFISKFKIFRIGGVVKVSFNRVLS